MTESSPSPPNSVNTSIEPNGRGDNRTAIVSYRNPAPQTSPQQSAELDLDPSHPLEPSKENLVSNPPESSRPRQQGLSLRVKANAMALALSTLPVLALGATTYYFVNQSITQQARQAKQSDSSNLAEITYLTFLLQRQIQTALAIGTGATALLAGAIAIILVNRAIRPVLGAAATAAATVKRLRKEVGELGTGFAGGDELVALRTDLNLMAGQLPDLLRQQKAEAERTQLLTEISLRVCECQNLSEVLTTTVKEVRQAIKADRVLIYRFNPDWSGTVVAESVASELPRTLGAQIMDPCFKERHIEQYRNGRVRVTNDIYQANLSDCHIELLRRFSVQANLVASVMKGDQLLGLLIAHQCSVPRAWQQPEINLFARVATQVGFALEHAVLLEQLEQARQELEGALRPHDRAIAAAKVGICIADASQPNHPLIYCNPAYERITGYSQAEILGRNCRFLQGADTDAATVAKIRQALRKHHECQVVLKNYRKDGSPFWNELTISPVRDEKGQVTHFIGLQTDISSLRQIVLQVQAAAQVVTQTTQGNKAAIKTLSAGASIQVGEIAAALDAIQAMAGSIQGVAASARQAKLNMQQAHQTVKVGDEAMHRTEAGMLSIRETLMETAKKVKHLGEVSRRISAVVNPINDFVFQTNILAMNLAVEVGRAGEDKKSRELITVAEAVRSLAQQSATATTEIEQLIAEIQTANDEVLMALKTEAEQLVAETKLVEETQQKLGQIVAVSAETSTLVAEIAQTAAVHVETSASVSQTMQEVATIADHTSEQSMAVADSFAYLLGVAQALQMSAAQFEVD